MEVLTIEDQLTTVQFPTLSDRIQSTFIDTLLIVVMMFAAAAFLERFDNVPDWIRIALFFGFWGIYEPVCTSLGCTVGNYIKGIRVRSHTNREKRINIFRAFFRYLFKVSLGWISFLSIHLNSERRAIHDLAAGSVMIKK